VVRTRLQPDRSVRLVLITHSPLLPVNTWNLWGCRVNATILMNTAQAMHDTGLQAAGYEYVNSDGEGAIARYRLPSRPDCATARGRAPALTPRARLLADCWMTAARAADGAQVADPVKFPDGFKAVADFIHSLGLKSGLYTAKGPNTCAGFAASCDHEVQDAAQWASWGIDVRAARRPAPRTRVRTR